MLRTVTVLYCTVCAGNFLENSPCSGDTARMSGPAAGGGETADGGTGHTELQVPQNNKYRRVLCPDDLGTRVSTYDAAQTPVMVVMDGSRAFIVVPY